MSSPMPLLPGVMCDICFESIADGQHFTDEEGDRWSVHRGDCAEMSGLPREMALRLAARASIQIAPDRNSGIRAQDPLLVTVPTHNDVIPIEVRSAVLNLTGLSVQTAAQARAALRRWAGGAS